MVILDSHLRDINGIEVIEQIRKEIPNQRIVFTTTHPLSKINTMVNSFGIDQDDILVNHLVLENYFLQSNQEQLLDRYIV